MTEQMELLGEVLRAATLEATRQDCDCISPRALFAGLFDAAFGVVTGDVRVAPLDMHASQVMSAAGTPFTLLGLARALAESDTLVGRILREQGDDLLARLAGPNPDVCQFLAPRVGATLQGGGLSNVDDVRLLERAAASFELARKELEKLGVIVTVLSSHRTTVEQREDYEVISSIVKDLRTFPVGQPGRSLHEAGLAIDIAYDGYLDAFRLSTGSEHGVVASVRSVMRSHGWFQFDRLNDPVHFSFGRIG